MNDQIEQAIAEHMQRLADAFATSQGQQPTMRDRFALAIVAGTTVNGSEQAFIAYAERVYDLAEALDAERRQRSADDAAKSDAGDGE